VAAVCRKLRITRQNYYARRRQRQRRAVDAELVAALVRQERQVQPRIGTRKLQVLLRPALEGAGVKLGRDRLFEVLRARQLLVPPPRAEFPCTTHSSHSLPVFQNRIKALKVTEANRVWVSDLTYLRSEEGFLYLALVTDKGSRKIVGHHCGDTLEAVGCLHALEGALAELPGAAKPIHHSDRGTQYCSHEYVQRLTQAGLEISMTEVDHCAENALAERMNGILKTEYLLGMKFKTKAGVRAAVEQAVRLYNTRRPHSALKMKVPAEVHSLAV
jgi:transposase InsO family protein